MKKIIRIPIQLCLALLAGCAMQSQKVKVQPTLLVSASEVGHGTPLALQVLDSRESNVIGRRGVGQAQLTSGTISAEGSIESQVF